MGQHKKSDQKPPRKWKETSTGLGIIACGVCGKPVRDPPHKVGARCPKVSTEEARLFTVPKTRPYEYKPRRNSDE